MEVKQYTDWNKRQEKQRYKPQHLDVVHYTAAQRFCRSSHLEYAVRKIFRKNPLEKSYGRILHPEPRR